jgi:hypothetical protein
MFMRMRHLTPLAGALALAATAAHAAPQQGQWSARVMGGMDFPFAGKLHDGTNAAVPNLGALNPDLDGVSGTLAIEPRGHNRIHRNGFGGALELGYGLSTSIEAFAGVRFQNAAARQIGVGNALVPALEASLPVTGRFGGLNAWSVEGGLRQYLATGGIQPYVAGRAGLTFTNSIRADFAVPDAAIALNDVPFYRNSVSATLGGDLGVAIPVSSGLDFNLETGVRWTSGLRGDDSALQGLGLQTINNVGSRWDVPVRAGFTVRF